MLIESIGVGLIFILGFLFVLLAKKFIGLSFIDNTDKTQIQPDNPQSMKEQNYFNRFSASTNIGLDFFAVTFIFLFVYILISEGYQEKNYLLMILPNLSLPVIVFILAKIYKLDYYYKSVKEKNVYFAVFAGINLLMFARNIF